MKQKIPLTKKKSLWAKGRDINLLGTKLEHNVSLEMRYARSLNSLINQMTQETKSLIKKLFQEDVSKKFFESQKKQEAMDASIGGQAKTLMNWLTNKFSKLFSLKAKNMAEKMLVGAEKTSKTNLHASLEKLTGGLSLKTSIITKDMESIQTAIIAENVSLIKSIPQEYFKQVTGAVMRSIQGEGIKQLIPDIEKYDGMTKRRATLIAQDQTRKAYNTINKQRMVSLGIKQFEWIHTRGSQSPRKSHLKMNGKIFSFENLIKEQANMEIPSKDRGLPGIAPNCRCTFRPIINMFDEE
jgi:SPP1 gp7 family putative phage head morphogenesis protein